MNSLQIHYRLFLACLLIPLLLVDTGMRSPSPLRQMGDSGALTHLSLATAPRGAGGDGLIIVARLTTVDGTPVAYSELVLLVESAAPVYAQTDSNGVAWLATPADLPVGEHTIRIGFAGKPGFAPAIGIVTLQSADRVTHDAVNRNAETVVIDATPLAREAAATPNFDIEPVHLLVQWSIQVRPGDPPVVGAHLITRVGEPLAGYELVLAGDGIDEIRAVTAVNGVATFHLPDDLSQQDHALRVVFPGAEHYSPAIAQAILHYHNSAPGAQDDSTPLPVVRAAPARESKPLRPPGLSHPIPLISHVNIPADKPGESPEMSAWPVAWVGLFAASSMHALEMSGMPWSLFLGAGLIVGLALAPIYLLGRRRAVIGSETQPAYARQFVLPLPIWYTARLAGIGVTLGLVVVLFLRPAVGLFFFWRVMIPLLPLLFFIAPGVWRNICPMATLNQTPRLFRFTRAWTTPRWMQRYGYLVAVSLFLVLVATRKVLFNTNGAALAILILLALAAAFVTGGIFRGKSGWCSSICPLLPVQRIYGQTPFANVTHAHCDPCIGCTKNCYDLNPKHAYLVDMYDDDRQFATMRKAFVGLFPGFILAFYLLPNAPAIEVWQVYALLAFAALVSLCTFFLIEIVTHATGSKITVLYGALALNLYYWFNAETLGSLLGTPPPTTFVWSLRALVLGLSLFWIYRTYKKEAIFVALTLAPQTIRDPFAKQKPGDQRTGGNESRNGVASDGRPVLTIAPDGSQFTVEPNRTLLELCERHNLPIEAGCRMGLCGADPVCVLGGMENLSHVSDDERTTLERLGLAPTTRLACMARVRGDVRVALTPDKPDVYRSSIVTGFKYDKSVEKVVIVGNGIAGVTAADHIRRRHPRCEIHLIGRERHHLYNRMGITRLICGRSAMQGLYLLPDQWYEDFNITCWLNTRVTAVDRQARTVMLGTGETLAYDRLILTTGSQSFVPPIEGYGLPGSFVLRTADDAMAIRTYVQESHAHRAVVAGGGLLGLEAAYGLHKLGLDVTVLERTSALLTRQLDARSSEFLCSYLAQLGIHVLKSAEAAVIRAHADSGWMAEVILHDGRSLPCDLLLVAAGIRADLALARDIGLELQHGVVVDELMRTSDPHIFAAGDVAEFDGRQYGLWPVAVSQAEVAAANAVAEGGVAVATYTETPPVTMLKVVGIDITSIGRITSEDGDEPIVLEDELQHRYRKLIIRDGKIVGAILLGYPVEAPGVAAAVKQGLDVGAHLADLRRGDWDALASLA